MDQDEEKTPSPKIHPMIVTAIIAGVFGIITTLITAYANLAAAGKSPDISFNLAFLNRTSSIEGTWVGTISASDESTRTQVTYFIKANCALGQACGTYETPVYGCEGDLIYNGVTQDVFEFTEKKSEDSPDFCKTNTIVRFTVAAGGELKVSSLYNGEQGLISSSGTLRRK